MGDGGNRVRADKMRKDLVEDFNTTQVVDRGGIVILKAGNFLWGRLFEKGKMSFKKVSTG